MAAFADDRRRARPTVGLLAPFVLVVLGGLTALAAEKVDKHFERWLRQVRLLFVPGEEEVVRQLRDTSDRREFQRLFWARRDPTPSTPENEFQEAIGRAWKRGDELFALPGRPGSETGCGQVLALLSEPLEVEGRELSLRFDNTKPLREGPRRPEVWVYRSRAGEPRSFTGGELRLAFDESCRFPEGGRALEDLRRIAESRVTRPELEYRRGSDGHLARLEDQLQGYTPGLAALLASERADFPLAVEPKMLLRAGAGGAYVAGLIQSTRPPAPPKVRVAAQVVDAGEPPGPPQERMVAPLVESSGAWLVSFGLPVKPGSHRLRLAVILPEGTASVTTLPLEVPDFEAPGLKIGTLLVYPDLEGAPPRAPEGPYAAFAMGPVRVEPRFGNVFTTKEALQVAATLTGAMLDPATGKAALVAAFRILRDGKPVAKGADQAFDTASAVASVGPVPLSGFAPGRYVVQLDGTDGRTGKSERREVAFEVRE